jgi:[acyl-carrier-protein] S-malonyltransferase
MKVGMLFPGYPSQFVGMGKDLYDNSRTIQEYFEEASNCLGMNFVKLCFASSDAELAKVSYAYPALFLSGASIAHMIQESCPTMTISGVAGYGVGEYSALYTANGITLPDGLYLLNKFTQFYSEMHEEMSIKTVIIRGLADRLVKQLCEEHAVEIVSFETDRHLITGQFEALESFIEAAKKAGSGRVKEIDAIPGVHTEALEGLVDQLTIYLTKVDFYDPEIPFISNTDGKVVPHAKKAQESLMQLLVKPLLWKNVLKQFADYDMLLVPGPSKALVAELSSIYPSKIIMGIESMADLEMLQELVHGGATEPVTEVA